MLNSSLCVYPDGSSAAGYEVCQPSAAQSACCFNREVCLTNNLCYSATGLIYQGACAGGWGNFTACPQHCADIAVVAAHPNDERVTVDESVSKTTTGIDNKWANLFPCSSSQDIRDTWWCGLDIPCDQQGVEANATRNELFSIPIFANVPAAILAKGSTPGCSVADTASSTITTGSVSAAPANGEEHSRSILTSAIVAVTILAVATIAGAAWAIWERWTRGKLQHLLESQRAAAKHRLSSDGGRTPQHKSSRQEIDGQPVGGYGVRHELHSNVL